MQIIHASFFFKFDPESITNVIVFIVSRASLILSQVSVIDKCTLASKFSITSVKAVHVSHTCFPWACEDRRSNCIWHFLFTTLNLAGHKNTQFICEDEFLYCYCFLDVCNQLWSFRVVNTVNHCNSFHLDL